MEIKHNSRHILQSGYYWPAANKVTIIIPASFYVNKNDTIEVTLTNCKCSANLIY